VFQNRIIMGFESLDNRIYAGLIVRELVNPLEAANNLAYLISVSTEHPEVIGEYVRLLEVQLASINHVVIGTLAHSKSASQP
jgi:hypothetical protein